MTGEQNEEFQRKENFFLSFQKLIKPHTTVDNGKNLLNRKGECVFSKYKLKQYYIYINEYIYIYCVALRTTNRHVFPEKKNK